MKTIKTHFFTTINFEMTRKAFYLFFCSPEKHATRKLEKLLASYINKDACFVKSFYNGRSALYHWIKMLWIKQDDEIILQAFTCVSVVNSIIQAWAKPVYCDIDNTLNIDVHKISKLITPKTKCILIQHTFWVPANISEIDKIAKEHWLYLIEDCAHAIWASYKDRKVGSYWDISIFSFGRDKVISCVNWGFLMVNNPKIEIWDIELKPLERKLIIKNLFYVLISFFANFLYDYWIWKFLIHFARKFSLVPEVVSFEEKKCSFKSLSYAMPNELAEIGLIEFQKIDVYNSHRIALTKFYKDKIKKHYFQLSNTNSEPIYLRLAFFSHEKQKLLDECRKERIILGNWYSSAIDPAGVSLQSCKYTEWTCSNAEKVASECLNLPNHIGISFEDANKVVNIINWL